jgi:DNA-binding NtrC family response regulator
MTAPKHIVVADDEAGVRSIVAEILRDAGYRVSTVGNGAALRAILGEPDRVDLVVLDALMPGERSRTLLAHLRELRIFVVAMSGHPVAMATAGELGLQLLEKPFRAAALEAAVDVAFASGTYGQRATLPGSDLPLTPTDGDPTGAGRPAPAGASRARRRRPPFPVPGRSGGVPLVLFRGTKSDSR